MSILNAFTAWLPYPVYRFVGGPIDGQEREVALVETTAGMVPLELWRVRDPVDVAELGPSDFNDGLETRASTYRFVPDWGQINIGHYEFVPEGKAQPTTALVCGPELNQGQSQELAAWIKDELARDEGA